MKGNKSPYPPEMEEVVRLPAVYALLSFILSSTTRQRRSML
jgi:hypothetical protein